MDTEIDSGFQGICQKLDGISSDLSDLSKKVQKLEEHLTKLSIPAITK